MIARGDSFQMKWNQTLLGDYFPHIGIVMIARGDSSHFR